MSRRRAPDSDAAATYGEDRLIDWLRRHPGTDPIGDDAAILESSGTLVVTTDTQVAGVHVPPDLDPARLARRLLAVNVSDIAAMGARPTHAFSVIAAPDGFDHRRFLHALTREAAAYGIVLAGGDLTSSPNLLTALTLIGCLDDDHRRLLRTGARDGHRLWVGGPVGRSRLGLEILRHGGRFDGQRIVLPADLSQPQRIQRAARRALRRHLQPEPQVALGQWLARETAEGGAIDLSDGLARDLGRMCRASSVGAEIELASLRTAVSDDALADRLGIDRDESILHGGEDYVLCFTLAPGIRPPKQFECTPIGYIRARGELTLVDPSGTRSPLEARGWDHLA